jgi:exosortase K
MHRKFEPYKVGFTGCALLAAYALKSHYSGATPDQLRWILWPTTLFVERMSGWSFEFEAGAGYISKAHFFLIAPSCSGVNFLMTSFLMLSLKWIWTFQSKKTQLLSLPLAAGIAFLTTLIANSVRISLAMAFQTFNFEQIHRIEGIVIYFGFLLILFLLSEKAPKVRQPWFPLLIYYGCALGIPLANGAFEQGFPFWEHTLFVLIVPLLMLTILQLFSLPEKCAQTFRASKAR